MNLPYSLALAECRGCLAALADQSPYELSIAYERLLLLLDAIHGDDVPALEPVDGDPGEVWARLFVGIDRLVRLRADLDLKTDKIDEGDPGWKEATGDPDRH